MSRLARLTTNNLTELIAIDAVAALRSGDLKSEDYARALLDQCERLKPLNAFITLDREAVLEAARGADQSRARGNTLGALFGLPIPLKDSICTSTLATTSGTEALRDFRPSRDAEIWRRLSQSQAVLLGKNNLHELSMGWTCANQAFGPVRNPYDATRIPGGSSGGTAAAIAARMAPVGIGEDTNGSVRVPAALCGIAGLRPTHGRYPGQGIVPLAPTLDTVGPMARTVADLCLIDTVVTGEPLVTTPADLRGLRLGVSRRHSFTDLDAGVEQVTEQFLARLKKAGATIVDAEIPGLAELMDKITGPIVYYEARRSISRFLEEQGAQVSFSQLVEALSPDIRKLVNEWMLPDSPKAISDQAYQDAVQKYRPALQNTWQDYFREHRLSAMVTPVVRMPAPRIPTVPTSPGFDVEINGILVPARAAFVKNISPSSSAGLPSIVLPVGMTDGLPVGVELDGSRGNDRELLTLALAIERTIDPVPAPNI